MELGVATFADVATGSSVSPAQRLRNLVEEARLADEVGLEVFGVGEHHRPDFAVSSPAVALAALAEQHDSGSA
jgi:alkanesulfonate monooxygenase SsuD/methylene tetrahydromethanopterin reductase-like flavin-dependent oxidoreductase (luciferase family)